MIIAKEKRRTNIAEYVIYMWHVEDLLRACKFDIDVVKQKVIEGFKADNQTSKAITEWYESLIDMMRSENVIEKGHMQLVKNTVADMSELHISMLQSADHPDYFKQYFATKSNIDAFRVKSNNPQATDIHICIEGLYSLLLLKMAGKEISQATIEAMDTFSKLLALFSQKFLLWEEGKLKL
jgi:hypothetical protein